MGNKEDWEEIEKWNKERDKNNNIKYGIDFSNIDKKKYKVDNFVRALNITGKGLKLGGIITLIIAIFIVMTIINIALSNMKSSFYVDVKRDIETSHFVKIKLISKDVVETYGYNNEDGKYNFEINKFPDIKFSAIKKGGKDVDDYSENLQKYLFNNWNSEERNNFRTEEYIESNGLLYYRNYIEISKYEELEEATEHIIHFMEYAEKWNKENKIVKNNHQKEGEFFVAPMGMTYIKINNKIITPYSETYITAQKIKNNAREMWENLEKKLNKNY